MVSVKTLVLAWGLLKMKSDSSYLYLIAIPPFNSVSIAENMRLTRVRASTQPCFTPLETAEVSPLSCTLASMPSWNWLIMAMNFLGQPYLAMILHWPSLLINSVEGLGRIDIGRVQVSVLFQRRFFKLPGSKHHVDSAAIFLEPPWPFSRRPHSKWAVTGSAELWLGPCLPSTAGIFHGGCHRPCGLLCACIDKKRRHLLSLTLSYDLEELMEFLSQHLATLFADLIWNRVWAWCLPLDKRQKAFWISGKVSKASNVSFFGTFRKQSLDGRFSTLTKSWPHLSRILPFLVLRADTSTLKRGWWSRCGGTLDFFKASVKFLHVIPVSISLDLICFISKPRFVHLTQLQLDGGAHVPQCLICCWYRVVKVSFVGTALVFQQLSDLSTVLVEPALVSSRDSPEPLHACVVHGPTEHSPSSFHFSVTVLVTFCPFLKFLSQIFSIFNNAGNRTLFSVCNHLLTEKLPSLHQSQVKLHFKWTRHKPQYNHYSNGNKVSKTEILNKIINRIKKIRSRRFLLLLSKAEGTDSLSNPLTQRQKKSPKTI